MLGKTQVKLILLMAAVNLVFSCLVTNCPRGGKRGKPDFHYPPNNIITSRLKKVHVYCFQCKLCSPDRKVCLGIYTGRCVAHEFCCFKSFCSLQKSCELDFYSMISKDLSFFNKNTQA